MYKLFISIIVTTLALDQVSKYYLIRLMEESDHILNLTSFFNLVMVWNPGVSFGMLQNIAYGQIILSVVAFIIISVLLRWFHKTPNRTYAWAFGLIIGGASGNVLDRLFYGAVADFFDLHVAGYHWPAFNIADVAVCLGAALLIIDSIWGKHHDA